jgi:hypothetical protein
VNHRPQGGPQGDLEIASLCAIIFVWVKTVAPGAEWRITNSNTHQRSPAFLPKRPTLDQLSWYGFWMFTGSVQFGRGSGYLESESISDIKALNARELSEPPDWEEGHYARLGRPRRQPPGRKNTKTATGQKEHQDS